MKTPLTWAYTQISDNNDIVIANDVDEADAKDIIEACNNYEKLKGRIYELEAIVEGLTSDRQD